jgi:hypothetical protein
MKAKSFETVVELEGTEVEVTAEYSFSPEMPGKTSGPPENCYPGEAAECEVETIYLTADPKKTDIMDRLATAVIEDVFEQACTAGEQSVGDDYDAAMEDKAEAARERSMEE